LKDMGIVIATKTPHSTDAGVFIHAVLLDGCSGVFDLGGGF
jgi:hypothetical protein